MKKSAMCGHQNFSVKAQVNRLTDTKQFMAEFTVRCADCDKPFQFLGLPAGVNLQGAATDPEALEARLAICPKGQLPSPLDNIAFAIRGGALNG